MHVLTGGIKAQRSQPQQFCYLVMDQLYGLAAFFSLLLLLVKLAGGFRVCLCMDDSGDDVVKALLDITHRPLTVSSTGLSNVSSQH